MTLYEYCTEYRPIHEKIALIKSDPIKRVLEMDSLPCDGVKMIDGQLQKVVEITSDSYISVIDLLSYSKEDVDKMTDVDFKSVYYAYMDNIDLTDISVESLMTAVRDYSANKDKKRELLNKCTK